MINLTTNLSSPNTRLIWDLLNASVLILLIIVIIVVGIKILAWLDKKYFNDKLLDY